jgi:hypothetical protein
MAKKDLQIVLTEMREYICRCVAEGYDSPQEIAQIAVDIFSDDAKAGELIGPAQKYTAEAIEAHLQMQLEWPEETDCDRLDTAFNHLERIGIVARQDFSCCGTCGSAEIMDEIDELRKHNLQARGYTFFHMQDTEAAAEGYGICLDYGSVEETEKGALTIGHEIVSILKEHGFKPVWDGTWSKRICFPIVWQRRYRYQ